MEEENMEEVVIDINDEPKDILLESQNIESESVPVFPRMTPADLVDEIQERSIIVPHYRMTPLRNSWESIYTPIVEHLSLQIRMNVAKKRVEIRTTPQTAELSALQKAADFVQAFVYGFEVKDAIALVRLDNIFVDTFTVKDVRQILHGDNLSRAIGRISGKDGRTKFAIENSTRTRIVIHDQTIHILGSFKNINMAKRAICDLIMGSPPGKVYGKLREVASRAHTQF